MGYNFFIMLRTLAVGILLTVGLPVYGEQKGGQSNPDQKQTQRDQTQASAVCTVEKEGSEIKCNWPQANPQPYLNRLFSPENLPNLLLFCVGIGGIVVGICTLRQLGKQNRIAAESALAARDAAEAARNSNSQTAEFFRIEKRPWVGMSKPPSLRDKKSTKPGHFGFTLEYVVKNFGVAPAFNTVVPFSGIVDGQDVSNYSLVRTKVNDARSNGENITNLTGDLLLPGAEITGTCEFPEIKRTNKFVITGCIVYRSADGTIHHTELSYWIDLAEGKKAIFRTAWFQAAT